MYAFIASALAAAEVPDELAEIPHRRPYRYRKRAPIVILDVFAQRAAEEAAVLERMRAYGLIGCDLSGYRRDWQDEIHASVEEIR